MSIDLALANAANWLGLLFCDPSRGHTARLTLEQLPDLMAAHTNKKQTPGSQCVPGSLRLSPQLAHARPRKKATDTSQYRQATRTIERAVASDLLPLTRIKQFSLVSIREEEAPCWGSGPGQSAASWPGFLFDSR
jgi:hypothetical protein